MPINKRNIFLKTQWIYLSMKESKICENQISIICIRLSFFLNNDP